MPPKAPAPEKRAASPQVARWKSAAEAARKARPKQDAAPFRKRAELPAKSKETKAAAAASEDVAKEAAEKAEGTPPVAGAPEDAATAEQPDVDPAVADVGARPMSAASKALHNGAWIPTAVCEGFMTKPLQLLLAVDGSAPSMMALEYLSEGIMQSDRNTSLTVYHVFDDSKTYLAPSYRRDAIEAVVEAKMTSSVSAKRWKMTTTRKIDKTAGTMVCEAINNLPADFTCLGFFGRKGCKVEARQLASNLLEVLRYGNSTNIVFKDDEAELLPLRRPTIFVVAACLDKCSTKAFLDALRLSKSGDEIHVMYVRSYMETSDSEYTLALRRKYCDFFSALQEEQYEVFHRFHDRHLHFEMVTKTVRESTAQAIVRYADAVSADFICLGGMEVKTLDARAIKSSISMQVFLETDRNFMVSHWIDVQYKTYEAHVRASTPEQGHKRTVEMLRSA
eukprot:TRINITY_DN34724_c0_g1_i2.p1 TRINITY_DN34724_c0_g1~~TRINITY_DN34724_c0_g1_i2.p1  ORF type:complete len:450 (-),score=140.34 TRINITY_DN34724_c0_g1_i2:347-1696(-)